MQKIADATKVVSINLTAEQYLWLVEQAGTRGKSELIRALIDEAMAKAYPRAQ